MYYFIGIKGSGMSSLAQIMDSLGFEVMGSDVPKHFFTEDELIKRGIKVLTFNKENINKDMIIVQGNAFNEENNEEVREAKKLGLEIISYQEAVGRISEMFETISVAGCHGKTTTTAMLSHVLNNICGCNYLIGDGTGYASKENKYFALESCEYKRHFLTYKPKYSIITNIELDHVDYFKDINDVIDAYQSFANNTKKCLVMCGDDENVRKLTSNIDVLYYGFNSNNDIVARNIKYDSDSTTFNYLFKGEDKGEVTIPMFGEHMLLNTLAVITVCLLENIDFDSIRKSLKTFKGAKRRFTETLVGNNVLVDDYAHHPTEVKATINSAKQKYPDKDIIAIFEPHTFSRTMAFADEVANVLRECDKVYIMDIYPSREKQEDYEGVTYKLIADKINGSEYITREEAYKLKDYDNVVLLFMSPNDLSTLENDYISLMKKLEEENSF